MRNYNFDNAEIDIDIENCVVTYHTQDGNTLRQQPGGRLTVLTKDGKLFDDSWYEFKPDLSSKIPAKASTKLIALFYTLAGLLSATVVYLLYYLVTHF